MERRSSRRETACLPGKIVWDRDCSFECTIRDRSETGARLEIPAGQIVPKRVVLIEMLGGLAYDCEVRWRAPLGMGVFFRRRFSLNEPLQEDFKYLTQHWTGANSSSGFAPGEVTDEMIRAGMAAYEAWKLDGNALCLSEREMIRLVYAAMTRAHGKTGHASR